MPGVFDPVRRREVFDEFLLRHLLDREKSQFMPSAVGNAAANAMADIVSGWLVGLHGQISPALAKYREWLEDSNARDERFGDHAMHVASTRNEAYGLCRWMIGNENYEPAFRQAIDFLEKAWETEWNDGRRPATREQRLECIDDYLKNCLQCGGYARGAEMYEEISGTTGVTGTTTITTAGDFGYWLCREYLGGQSSRDAVVRKAEPFLIANLERNWLGSGQALKAAAWLKIVYWHSGVIDSPIECIRKAYDLMPHVKRPAFA